MTPPRRARREPPPATAHTAAGPPPYVARQPLAYRPRPERYRRQGRDSKAYPQPEGKALWVARIRTVKPEFWDDDTVGSLTRNARLLFVATWNFADDEGIVRWSPEYLKASAFMYDDDIGHSDIRKWMNELEEAGFVYSYMSGRLNQRLGFIVNFRKHQRIDKPQPGKLPPPPWTDPAVVLMYARRDRFTCHLCGEPVNGELVSKPADPYNPDLPDMTGLNPSPDHVVPRSNGGSDYPTNIKTAHLSCNKGRGNRPTVKPQVRAPSGKHSGAFPEDSANIPGTLPEPSQEEGKGGEGIREGSCVDAPASGPSTLGQNPPYGNLPTAEPRTDRNGNYPTSTLTQSR